MKKIVINNGSHFEGELLGRSGDFLIGWVRNVELPEQMVSVDLFGDGQWLSTTRTGLNVNLMGADLAIAERNVAEHGFAFFVESQSWLSIARFEVAIANIGYLPGVYFTYATGNKLPPLQSSRVVNYLGLRLTGWVWESLNPKYQHTIRAYENGRLLAECVADKHSYELAEFGCMDTRHGFSLTLPMTLADGLRHEVKVYTAQGKELMGSPVIVLSPETSYCAWIDALAIKPDDGELLKACLTQYGNRQPLSVDFSAYQPWFYRFGKKQTEPVSDKLAILIVIDGLEEQKRTLDCIINQTYTNWMALVVKDAVHLKDSRIHYIEPTGWQSELRRHLGANFDIVSFVAAGDTLECHAFACLVDGFANPQTQIIYSDCDKILTDGSLTEPWFKPDWDVDLFLAGQLIHHLFATRLNNLPLQHPFIDEVNAWPWLAVETVGDVPGSILHIPSVLYHRNSGAKQVYNSQAQQRCDERIAPEISRTQEDSGATKINYKEPDCWPTVSLIVPTRDHVDLLRRCLDSLCTTDYPSLEVIVVNNDSFQPETLDYLAQIQENGIKVIDYPGVFNFSAINNRAVSQTSSTIIGLINNDIEVIEPTWLKTMVTQLMRPNVGVVGAKLLWPNGMVQHAGVLLGLHGVMGHTGNNWYKNDSAYFGYNQLSRTVSAVTGACLLTRRTDYLAVGGLDEMNLPINFSDVDFCLKLRQQNKRTVWSSEAQLIHAESASRGGFDTPAKRGHLVREKHFFMEKWQDLVSDDPYYNPNLNLDEYSYAGIAIPPRTRKVKGRKAE